MTTRQLLAQGSGSGVCGDTCGCAGDDVSVPASPAEPGPIACTLSAGDVQRRVEAWAELLDPPDGAESAVVARSVVDGGVRLQFGPGADATAIVRLAAAEQDCCRFFSFNVSIDTRGVGLEVRAPAEAADMVAALFGAVA